MNNLKDTLYEILNELDADIDYAKEEKLIDDHVLDSFAVISLISELEDAFDIQIEAADIVPANFNSADAMLKMIIRILES